MSNAANTGRELSGVPEQDNDGTPLEDLNLLAASIYFKIDSAEALQRMLLDVQMLDINQVYEVLVQHPKLAAKTYDFGVYQMWSTDLYPFFHLLAHGASLDQVEAVYNMFPAALSKEMVEKFSDFDLCLELTRHRAPNVDALLFFVQRCHPQYKWPYTNQWRPEYVSNFFYSSVARLYTPDNREVYESLLGAMIKNIALGAGITQDILSKALHQGLSQPTIAAIVQKLERPLEHYTFGQQSGALRGQGHPEVLTMRRAQGLTEVLPTLQTLSLGCGGSEGGVVEYILNSIRTQAPQCLRTLNLTLSTTVMHQHSAARRSLGSLLSCNNSLRCISIGFERDNVPVDDGSAVQQMADALAQRAIPLDCLELKHCHFYGDYIHALESLLSPSNDKVKHLKLNDMNLSKANPWPSRTNTLPSPSIGKVKAPWREITILDGSCHAEKHVKPLLRCLAQCTIDAVTLSPSIYPHSSIDVTEEVTDLLLDPRQAIRSLTFGRGLQVDLTRLCRALERNASLEALKVGDFSDLLPLVQLLQEGRNTTLKDFSITDPPPRPIGAAQSQQPGRGPLHRRRLTNRQSFPELARAIGALSFWTKSNRYRCPGARENVCGLIQQLCAVIQDDRPDQHTKTSYLYIFLRENPKLWAAVSPTPETQLLAQDEHHQPSSKRRLEPGRHSGDFKRFKSSQLSSLSGR